MVLKVSHINNLRTSIIFNGWGPFFRAFFGIPHCLFHIFHPTIHFITHNVVYALLRKLAIKPRFADTIFCLLRLKLVLQKLDNTTKLSSPHRQHFRDYSCSSWSLERRKSGAPRVTCLRAVSSQREAHSQKLLELCEGAPNIYFLSKAPRRTRMVS